MTRAFIIGNGPSLAHTNLDLIKGEVSFATNRIHLIFPMTTWRPTYYVRAESPYATAETLLADLKAIFQEGMTSYLNPGFREAWHSLMPFEHRNNTVNFLPNACEHTLMHHDDKDRPKEWHDPICAFGSSLHVAMQLAVQMGYTELYLLGCDLDYQQGKPSHFSPVYEKGYEEKMKPAKQANLDLLCAHSVAFGCCPVPIYNATIGGKLELYPRVVLEDIMKAAVIPPIPPVSKKVPLKGPEPGVHPPQIIPKMPKQGKSGNG